MSPIMHEVSSAGLTTRHVDADAAIRDVLDCLARHGEAMIRTTFRQMTPLGPVNRTVTTRF